MSQYPYTTEFTQITFDENLPVVQTVSALKVFQEDIAIRISFINYIDNSDPYFLNTVFHQALPGNPGVHAFYKAVFGIPCEELVLSRTMGVDRLLSIVSAMCCYNVDFPAILYRDLMAALVSTDQLTNPGSDRDAELVMDVLGVLLVMTAQAIALETLKTGDELAKDRMEYVSKFFLQCYCENGGYGTWEIHAGNWRELAALLWSMSLK